MGKVRLSEIAKLIRAPVFHADDELMPECRVVYHRSISLEAGIVDVASAPWERLDLKRLPLSRYRLLPGDTVMVFNGVKDRVGICGLFIDDCKRTVPATSLCAIRPTHIDPVWLFHRLRNMRTSLMELFKEKKAQGYIPMRDLGAVEIEIPATADVQAVNGIWKLNVEKWRESRRLLEEIAKANDQLSEIIK